VLSIYGGQVCPYIEGLGVMYWLMVLGGFFLAAIALRSWLARRQVLEMPYERMMSAQFFHELGIFLSAALAITVFNMMAFEFPLDSGLKILVGTMTLGFFASADLALERERFITEHFISTGEALEPREEYFPLTAKFFMAASTSVVLLSVVIFLVISKDLEWLGELGRVSIPQARMAVLVELGFIAVVVLLGIMNLIVSYSRNLKMFLENENSSLKAVAHGDFSRRVPVSSNDEFGVMAWYTNRMIDDLGAIIAELRRTQDATILSLASLAEIRDMETGRHIIRTSLYVKALTEHLSLDTRYSAMLDPEKVELMHKSAPLHDIGKVGIPDSVLLKPARLTPEEFEVMKRHPTLGGDALGEAEKVLGESSFLTLAREIAYSHHEKWDGSGYPKGLKGEEIPLSGRLMSLADVYDALVFKRVYKPALSHDEAKRIIVADRGRHFCPDVVDAFLELEDEFKAIVDRYGEE
jgi:HD-GYP domain-containing protein (c-di-GMP phosphodiesterase class II)